MLQILDLTQKNIIATRAIDLPGINEYGKIYPLVHNILNSGKKVRWYFEIEGDPVFSVAEIDEGNIIKAQNDKMDFIHPEDIERIAIVGDKKFKRWIDGLMKPFVKARKMYFDLSDKTKAKEWIKSEDEIVPL